MSNEDYYGQGDYQGAGRGDYGRDPYDRGSYDPSDAVRSARAKVMAPAICMMIFAGLWMAWIMLNMAVLLLTGPQEQDIFGKQQENKELIYTLSLVMDVVIIICQAIILFGGIQMIRLQTHGMALVASGLSCVPCLSPCCVLGIPFGIWGLIMLNNEEVKRAFR